MSNTYNGWTNYETWCVNLWITNDEYSDQMLREQAAQAAHNAVSARDEGDDDAVVKSAAVTELADYLEQWAEDQLPELSGFAGDLLTTAMQQVDWREIAHNALEDIDFSELIREYTDEE